ncbi:hypothetical protein BSQ33_00595 [Vibrio gazogenes]|uniref:Uncharacterized protein n=2 Tax=Vibrio gazogenes TaxID=687 RepID=A0A1Z2SB68_VIBGA|nr:hypothetical protein BSQ33_00595 [Vibrio gazogenes]
MVLMSGLISNRIASDVNVKVIGLSPEKIEFTITEHQRYLEQIDGFEVVGIATNRVEAEVQLSLLAPDLILLDGG